MEEKDQQKLEDQKEERKSVLICGRKVKNRKVALIMCYLGAGYQGMQRNPGAKTIESDLEKALHLSGGIQDDFRFNYGRLQWSRAARTDKGVSAVAQVVSINMLVPRNDPQDMPQEINKHLPKQIKIMGLIRTTPRFDAKGLCDYRVYEYLLPVWVLNPNNCKSAECIVDVLSKTRNKKLELDKLDDILQEVLGHKEKQQNQPPTQSVHFHDFQYNNSEQVEIPTQFSEAFQQQQNQNSDFKLTAKLIQRLNLVLRQFEGTHNFWNFTNREKVDTPNLVRYIRKFCVAGLLNFKRENSNTQNDSTNNFQESQNRQNVDDINDETKKIQKTAKNNNINIDNDTDGVNDSNNDNTTNNISTIENYNIDKNNEQNNITNEHFSDCWIRLQVTGQSFLLYQIRKMISLAIAIMRNEAPEDAIETALKPTRDLNVPPAPAAPLYLNECNFSSYNQKWGDDRQKVDPMNDYADQIMQFKKQILHPYIYQFCKDTKVFEVYCYNLRDSAYKFSQWKDMEETRQNLKQKRKQEHSLQSQEPNKIAKKDTGKKDGN
eukprot:TRINITY_DN14458_c0_g1_i1.p1 TRINITY_DN14458_c0_g1~~TRINITY_DN14458_c0_g1_i1.p1  ORF type:complete len:609 (-),score=69.69 TRINITY_DN14458_c0_g1_i1:167-1807(-)